MKRRIVASRTSEQRKAQVLEGVEQMNELVNVLNEFATSYLIEAQEYVLDMSPQDCKEIAESLTLLKSNIGVNVTDLINVAITKFSNRSGGAK